MMSATALTAILALAGLATPLLGTPSGNEQRTRGSLAKIFNNPNDSMFVDSADGRTRMLYGITFVNMLDDMVHVSDESLDIFSRQWGFNTARLGFLWNLIEIAPGKYNDTYLNELEKAVDRFNDHGIYVILDMHQDLWSKYTCGHGLPTFYGKPPHEKKFEKNGAATFPKPIGRPQYNSSDNDAEFPQITNCEQIFRETPLGWTEAHFTYAVMAASQRLYDNADGIRDRFGDMWQTIAKRFAAKPNVIGYELINDPWLGNAPLSLLSINDWKRLPLWYSNHDEKVNLEPMYNYLYERISAEDNQTMIFFEPVVGGNFFASMPTGFTAGPGGVANGPRQALSYHLYCVFSDNIAPILPSWLPKFVRDWIEKHGFFNACKQVYSSSLNIRENDFKKLQVGGLLTEFGAVSNDTSDFDDVALVINDMEKRLQGWLYFGLPNPEAKELCPSMKFCVSGERLELAPQPLAHLFARPKALAIPGVPITTSFDNVTHVYALEYKPSADPNIFSQAAEIFVNATEYYPSKGSGLPFSIIITPLVDGVQTLYDSGRNVLSITFDSSLVNEINLVRIEIHPKKKFDALE